MCLSLAVSTAGPARADPRSSDDLAFEALIEDLERIIEVQQAGSWRIDRYEIEDMMPAALMTVCKIPPQVRKRAIAYYERKIREQGGPIEEAWKRDKDLDHHKLLLFYTRVRALLVAADARSATDCPVYLAPERDFHGWQSDAHRWALNVETGGLLQLRRSGGHWTYGGGGLVRLLVSRGFTRHSLLFGPEFAGGAMLRVGAEGFVVNYFPAFPVVLRIHDRSWHYDVEVAPVALFQADDIRRSFGFRFGLSTGTQARRTRGVIPWAGIAFAYETYPSGARPAAQFIRGGFRFGIIW
ncbi:MAG: hypothetical protein ACXVEF_25520 [Polyangiales bacterium]